MLAQKALHASSLAHNSTPSFIQNNTFQKSLPFTETLNPSFQRFYV